MKDNLFIDDPVGMSFGLVNGATTTAGGVTGSVTGNVFIGGGNIGTMQGGQALVIGNVKAGVIISGKHLYPEHNQRRACDCARLWHWAVQFLILGWHQSPDALG